MYKTIRGDLHKVILFQDTVEASARASTLHMPPLRAMHDGFGLGLVMLVAVAASAPSHGERHDAQFFFVVGISYVVGEVRCLVVTHTIVVVAHVEVGQNFIKRPFREQLFVELGLFFLMFVVALVAERENVL